MLMPVCLLKAWRCWCSALKTYCAAALDGDARASVATITGKDVARRER